MASKMMNFRIKGQYVRYCFLKLVLKSAGHWVWVSCNFCLFLMHQSILAVPSPPVLTPRNLPFCFIWIANSREKGQLSCQMPGSGDKSRGQMPHPKDCSNQPCNRFYSSCTYHVLLRESTPGIPLGNPWEPGWNGTVLIFLFSPQEREVV